MGKTDIGETEIFQRRLGPWQGMCGSGREGTIMSMIGINMNGKCELEPFVSHIQTFLRIESRLTTLPWLSKGLCEEQNRDTHQLTRAEKEKGSSIMRGEGPWSI